MSNPFQVKSDDFQTLLKKFEKEVLQNYSEEESLAGLEDAVKQIALVGEKKDEAKEEAKNKAKPRGLVKTYPWLRFFNPSTKMYSLVTKTFLENHYYDKKRKQYVSKTKVKTKLKDSKLPPEKFNQKILNMGLSRIAVRDGSFKRVFFVNNQAVSIELGPSKFVNRRRKVFNILNNVVQKNPSLKSGLQFPSEFVFDLVFTDNNDSYYACTMASDICVGSDLFTYQISVINTKKRWQTPEQYYKSYFHNYVLLPTGMKVPEATHIFGQLFRLLHVLKRLHESGLALIDIKPENILLCGKGGFDLKLSDLEGLITVDDVPKTINKFTATARYSAIIQLFTRISKGLLFYSKDKMSKEAFYYHVTKLPFLTDFSPDDDVMFDLNFLLLSFTDFHAMSLVILEMVEDFFLKDVIPFANTSDGNVTLYKPKPLTFSEFQGVLSKLIAVPVLKKVGKDYREMFELCYKTLLIGKKVFDAFASLQPSPQEIRPPPQQKVKLSINVPKRKLSGQQVFALLSYVSKNVGEWQKFLAPVNINPMLLKKEEGKEVFARPLLF